MTNIRVEVVRDNHLADNPVRGISLTGDSGGASEAITVLGTGNSHTRRSNRCGLPDPPISITFEATESDGNRTPAGRGTFNAHYSIRIMQASAANNGSWGAG